MSRRDVFYFTETFVENYFNMLFLSFHVFFNVCNTAIICGKQCLFKSRSGSDITTGRPLTNKQTDKYGRRYT